MQPLIDLIQSPIVIITAIVLGLVCETFRRLVPVKAGDPGWRGVIYVISTGKTPDSQGVLPVILSIPIGFVPWLPAAECLIKPGTDEMVARFGTYLVGGIVCSFGYTIVVGTVMNIIRHVNARGGSGGAAA